MLFAALFAMPAAHALDTGDIVIVGLKGDVHVTMKGAERTVKAGTVLELPATVRTGSDGTIDLRQGETSVSVGPDTLLEFPALEKAGGPIDRIIQPRGNAFYSIGKRGPRKLRVETPYLVGVVKGTQFNVSAQDTGTTISLFEGLLEIRASDDSSVVDIKAGEIATRSVIDTGIGVLQMDPGKVVPPPRAPQGSRNDPAKVPVAAVARATPPASDADARTTRSGDERAAPSNAAPLMASPADDGLPTGAAASEAPPAEIRADLEVAAATVAPEIGAASAVDVSNPMGPHVAAPVEMTVDTGAPAVDASPAAGVTAGAGAALDVGVATDVNIGSGIVDAGAGASVAAPAAIEHTVDVGVDLGGSAGNVDLGSSTSADAGNAGGLALGAGPRVDVGNANAASVDVNAGVDVRPLSTDVSAGAAIDLGGNPGAANVDLGAHAGPPDVTPVNAGINAGAGAVDLGVNLGGAEVNVGVDLGVDEDDDPTGGGNGGNGSNSGPGNAGNEDNSGKGNVVDDVVDTIDDTLKGLLRKPGKK